MRKLEAIICPSELEDLREGLAPWVTELTVSEVSCSHGHECTEAYRGARWTPEFASRIKVELVIPSSLVPRITDVISRALRVRDAPDGPALVIPVDDLVDVGGAVSQVTVP
jgi:nitrogen regulatory protein P-II 1